MNLRRALIIATAAIVASASIYALAATYGSSSAAKPSAADSKTERKALSVAGVRVVAQPYAETILANGTLQAEESIELQTEVNGKVVAINFDEGQRVTKGDLLVKIDDSSLQADLRKAIARRDLAAIREQRLLNLVENGGVSQLAVDEAKGELSVIEAELEGIRADIAKTEIKAPFDGTVGIRFISTGAYVNPNTRIATLQGIANLKVDFSIPERYASIVKTGDTATFKVSGSTEIYEGRVIAIEPRIDISTRSILIRAIAANQEGVLHPGQFASVEYTLSSNTSALLVPAIALILGLEERFLFVEKDGVADRISVKVGARTSSDVVIEEGLNSGDVVITTGIQQLRPGIPVSVTLKP